ncbi:hypothetical protein [Arthrobacter bambusae]|uniref:hypothetical protein n=1 Tax=Arthrobacter bambusae TaxID=1338426 RepID=UPI00278202D7|nr:hypothetical protein [Arthrobacter bambusae]MDQ0030148.1 hypothetical protein [Arthrobacter bambusae]MDQ0097831.1 hypothetical protein [Arthrobacter bambusae]
MDAETIRLLITAGTAIVAGLGGAGVTAAINRKNTKDTLNSTRSAQFEQWRLSQERDREIWLRDQKLQAYTDFMLKAQSLHASLDTLNFRTAPQTNPKELIVERGKVKILGSPSVRYTARDLDNALTSLYAHHRQTHLEYFADDDDDPSESEAAMRRRHARIGRAFTRQLELNMRFSSVLILFVEEVRKDIGTHTPDDEGLNSGNRALIRSPEEDVEKEEPEIVLDEELA